MEPQVCMELYNKGAVCISLQGSVFSGGSVLGFGFDPMLSSLKPLNPTNPYRNTHRNR